MFKNRYFYETPFMEFPKLEKFQKEFEPEVKKPSFFDPPPIYYTGPIVNAGKPDRGRGKKGKRGKGATKNKTKKKFN